MSARFLKKSGTDFDMKFHDLFRQNGPMRKRLDFSGDPKSFVDSGLLSKILYN